MKYDKYTIEALPSFSEFYSEGPKGRIRKQVVFTSFENNPQIYNLVLAMSMRLVR
ncbi:DUF6934 family protein [Ohtaekwangia sp.]|uniref:DUF6934 family protein n=1 Tax=Ohtaekwangia sp. TaxID=2066019 RepID=UPI0039C95FC1